MEEVRLNAGGKFRLYRERDRAGDSGPVWRVYDGKVAVKEQKYEWIEDASGLVRVGDGIRVGSLTARSYSYQDWWQCSPVTEIVEVKKNDEGKAYWVKFKTGNSTYVAEAL